jgi:hypothetical protein
MAEKNNIRLRQRFKMTKLLFGLFCLATSFPLAAQTIEFDWVQISGNDIIVHYSIDDQNPLHAYTVNLFSSHDNFAAPLLKLSGDHGNEVKAGKGRQIHWHITEELGKFSGGIELEVRARMYVPFMKMTEFKSKAKYKRGKNYPLVWRSGNPGGQVDIELYNGNSRIHSDRNVANSGKFDWQIPSNAKPGSGYKLKFTNVKSREETFFTEPFKIVNKIPLVAKVAAGALIGVGVFILTRGKNPTGTSVTADDDLPPFDETPTN